ncbi:MAG: hypothetical protein JST00_07320 [Deltaproteobacteria bacterium]|nr:hypothetical protein [Deltaproteobacteria bacterium]
MKPHSLLALVALGALALACGGKPAKAPLTSDEAPKDEAPAGGDEASSAPAPPPPAEPVVIACESKPATCGETSATGDEVEKAKERCTSASGEPHDGPCSRDNLAATCEIADKKLSIFTYAAGSPGQTKGRVKGAKGTCEAAGGTFTPAHGGGKGAGTKKGGRGKKKK